MDGYVFVFSNRIVYNERYTPNYDQATKNQQN